MRACVHVCVCETEGGGGGGGEREVGERERENPAARLSDVVEIQAGSCGECPRNIN